MNIETFPRTRPTRRNPHLPDYDYASDGAYFVTLVTKNRALIFEDAAIRSAVEAHWRWLREQYDYVRLDDFVVMPNHLHGILILETAPAGRSRTAPTEVGERRKPLGGLIGAFKTVSTQAANDLRNTPGAQMWQRGFYEHVMRTEQDIDHVREYIRLNPEKWNEDPENPAGL